MNKKQLAPVLNSFVVRYGTAALLTLAALVVTLLIWSVVQSLVSPLFLAAIGITAWKKGFGPGIFATLLSGFALDYFFTKPEFEFVVTPQEITRIFIFALEGFVLSWLISGRSKAVEEIQNSREQLLALSTYQQTLREEERKHIALEIHDELGQSLTGLKMELHLLNRQIKDSCHPGSDSINDSIADMMHLINNSIGTVRRIATELRPPILDDLGLIAALEWQLGEFQRRTSVSCNISSNIENINIKNEFAITIFRIFQESLTNIMRHAEANSVRVNLREKDSKLVLRIEDNGKGIPEENITTEKSLGILGMHERARQIGADLQIFKGPEAGTTVLLTVPLV
jgi:signal transduction histidine kinase